MGGKHFVRMVSATVLMVGSLIVVGSSPASAFKYFVHGNLHCTVTSGSVGYSPVLRATVSQTTRMRIKGTLSCDKGETGIGTSVVTSGTFKALSQPFGGTCTSITPDQIEMTIKWNSSNGLKIRNTEVSWFLPVAVQTDPTYELHYAGAKIEDTGVSGSYLGGTAAVNFVGTNGATNLCSTGKLRGTWPLDTTGASDLTFQAPPFITSVSPDRAILGAQNQDLVITGQDFSADDAVSFSGDGITVNSTTYVSESEVDANISIDPGALAGTRDVTITNASLGSSTCASCFMVSPVVSGVSPATAGQGAQNRNITITGEGFAPGAITEFGPAVGSPITTNYTQFVDDTTLVANISVSNGASLGAYDVTVTDPGFGVGACIGCFSVNGGPTVTNTSPSSRGAGAINQVVAVNGTGFAPGSTVTFGGSGISLSNTSYVSPTQLLVTMSIAPGTLNGPRSVTVVNSDGGQGSCAACFTVNKGPTITLWDVIQNSSHHGFHSVLRIDTKGRTNRDMYTTDIAITGTNFQPGATVSYANDWVHVNSTTYVSTTKITQNVTVDVQDDIDAPAAERVVTVKNADGGTGSAGAVVLVG